MSRETIAAIATPVGVGAIGVIRLSGPEAFRIATELAPSLGDAPVSHRAVVARLVRGDDLLDEALVLPFRGPRSFTGEDVVELQCHGGRVTLRRVLDACLDAGARMAEPGEFSRRAMVNGKLDLLQVEAIADVIHARGEAAHRLAQRHLAGRLSSRVDALKAPLADLLTLVEAAIDFSLEEHVYSIGPEEIVGQLDPVQRGVDELLGTYDSGRLQHDGVRLAIVGPPNAGKSSLLNELLGEERALVTEIAGTTRDYLEEGVVLDGVVFRVVDTAGLRETDDRVEAMGVARARGIAEAADVLVVVGDAAAPEGVGEVVAWALEVGRARTPAVPVGLLWNKVDLTDGSVPALEEAEGVRETLAVSLTDSVGVDGLRLFLLRLAAEAGLQLDEDTVLIARARHRDALLAASAALERARGAAEMALDHELVALDLREGLDALGSLTGAVTSDDILGRIFGDFCVGK